MNATFLLVFFPSGQMLRKVWWCQRGNLKPKTASIVAKENRTKGQTIICKMPHRKSHEWVTWTPLKTSDELRWSRGVCSSFSKNYVQANQGAFMSFLALFVSAVLNKNVYNILPLGSLLNNVLWWQPSLILDLHQKCTFYKGLSKKYSWKIIDFELFHSFRDK